MNMLTSLKALLFTSTPVMTPPAGEQVEASGARGMDFAQLLEGSMADSPPAPALINTHAAPIAQTGLLPVGVEGETPALPEAEPGSHAVWRAGESALPPGLALGLIKHAAVGPAAQSNGQPGAIAATVEDVAEMEPAQEAPIPEASAPEAVEVPRPEIALPKAEQIAQKADANAERLTAKTAAKPEQVPSEAAAGTDEAEPETADKIEQAKPPVEPQLPSMAVVAAMVEPKIIPAEIKPEKGAAQASAAVVPGEGTKVAARQRPLKPLPQAPAADLPPKGAMPAVVVEGAPRRETEALHRQPASASPERKSPTHAEQPVEAVAAGGQLPDIPDSLPEPVLNGKPVKAEALSLLQIVREQVAARQPGEPERAGEQVAAAARARPVEPPPATDIPAPIAAAPLSDSIASLAAAPAQPAASPAIPSAAPMADLSATLGAQVVDMGVSGQWIDGLARDIAGLSAHGAQGRFHLNTDQLGAVQVDIRQGSEGAAVSLTVASEAAEIALRQDSDRLKLDAGLAAVRIAEVKIERAVPEASRSDSASQQSPQQQSQNSSSNGQAAWQNGGQAMGQSTGQQGRWQGRENNGFGAKSSGDPAVLNHADARREASEPQRARYA